MKRTKKNPSKKQLQVVKEHFNFFYCCGIKHCYAYADFKDRPAQIIFTERISYRKFITNLYNLIK